MHFIDTIKELLLSKKMTQSELAERIGFSEVYLSDIMRGKKGKNISVENLARFAKALDVPITYFFTRDKNELTHVEAMSAKEEQAIYIHYGDTPRTITTNDFEFIPLYNAKNADKTGMIDIADLNKEWIAIPSKIAKHYNKLLAFTMHGDSMLPVIKDGDTILAAIYKSPPKKLDSKKIYLCKIEQNSRTVYAFRKAHLSGGQYLTLFPLNPNDKVIEFNLGKGKTCPQIIGHAVWQSRNIEQG